MKFLCKECKGINEVDFDDQFLNCGHCNAVCKVPEPLTEGVVIDDFLILKLLGNGGMGNVFLAHDFPLDRKIALKILHEDISQDEKFNTDFVREARSVASLNHNNIIQAYKVGEDEGRLFFAMEFVEGQNLLDMLKNEGSLDEMLVLDVAYDISLALGYAWDKRKLVHRDIKPENIMISDQGVTKLMDLGLSCQANELVDDGDKISGTPQYISPEQILGYEIDIRTDFYCLGASLYHMLAGQFPFDGNLKEMVRKHIQEPPLSLKKLKPEVTGSTVKLIQKLMSKKPEERFQTSEELCKEVKHCKRLLADHRKGRKHLALKGNAPTSYTVTNTERLRRQKKHEQEEKNPSKVPVSIICGLALIIVISSIFLLVGNEDKTELPTQSNTDSIKIQKPVVKEYSKNDEPVSLEEKPGLNKYKFKVNLKDINKLSQVQSLYDGSYENIGEVNFENDNAGYILKGLINVPENGSYELNLKSGGYCHVELNGYKVISHASNLPETTKKLALTKGKRKIKIVLYQTKKSNALLDLKVNGKSLDPSLLSHFKNEKETPEISKGELLGIKDLIDSGKKVPREKLKKTEENASSKTKTAEIKKVKEPKEPEELKEPEEPVLYFSFDESQVEIEGKGLKSSLYGALNIFDNNKFKAKGGKLGDKVTKTYKDQIKVVNSGVRNQSLEFSGSREHRGIAFSNLKTFDDRNFTLSFWFKPEYQKGFQYLAEKIGKSNKSSGWMIFTKGDDLFVRIMDTSGNIACERIDISESFGKWQNLTVSINSDKGLLESYLNGSREGWTSKGTKSGKNIFKKGARVQAKATMVFGNIKTRQRAFIGSLDELTIWQRSLSEKEVMEKYQDVSKDIKKVKLLSGDILLAYESFDYAKGKTISRIGSGGKGWSSKWQFNGQVMEGSLNVEKDKSTSQVSGNHLMIKNTRCERYLKINNASDFSKVGLLNKFRKIGANGKSIYLSFLYSTSATRKYHEFMLTRDKSTVLGFGNNVLSSQDFHLSVGAKKNNLILEGNDKVNFVVIRVDYHKGDDEVMVYMNPESLIQEDESKAWKSVIKGDFSFDGIAISSSGIPVLKIDEIRIGNTYKAVTK